MPPSLHFGMGIYLYLYLYLYLYNIFKVYDLLFVEVLQVRDYYLILRRDLGLLNDVETDIENGCGDFQILFKLSIFSIWHDYEPMGSRKWGGIV